MTRRIRSIKPRPVMKPRKGRPKPKLTALEVGARPRKLRWKYVEQVDGDWQD